MSRGQPDFGMYAVKEVSASISDMGEVAARLGSIVIFDKRGDVVDFDNFEQPVLRWDIDNASNGTYVRLSTSSAKSGSQSVELHTDDIAEEYVAVERSFILVATKRLGFEVSFSSPDAHIVLYIYTLYYDGTSSWEGEIKYEHFARKLSIKTAASEYTEITTFGARVELPFHYDTLKLVLDFTTKKYVRLLYGAVEYDISAYNLVAVADAPYAARIRNGVWIENIAAEGGSVWIDDSIFTQAEP